MSLTLFRETGGSDMRVWGSVEFQVDSSGATGQGVTQQLIVLTPEILRQGLINNAIRSS